MDPVADVTTEASAVLCELRAYLEKQGDFGLRAVPGRSVTPELTVLGEKLQNCTECSLSGGRRHVVFGIGDPNAEVMFVGEAPGAEEDRQGVPFVGAAGQLLTKMIESIGLLREDVYIANVIKCRPPGNRDPEPAEVASCEPFLKRQIDLIKPSVICTLGRFAAQTLLKTSESMGRLRGRLFVYEGTKVVPTYHPAALLRNPQWKRPTWEDLRMLRREYDGMEI
jgi:uracil-DNA glycosylase family 4